MIALQSFFLIFFIVWWWIDDDKINFLCCCCSLLSIHAGLWELAQEADFDADELHSLRQELHHFQVKLDKFRHLEAEIRSVDERKNDEDVGGTNEKKTQGRLIMDKKLKKHMESIDHLQKDLELKIASRHSEL